MKDTDARKPKMAANHTHGKIDSSAWVDEHGDVLYRYALARVRRPDTAEELVQEALLSALQSKDRFEGRSTERTWLIGILRHKILDHFRTRSRGRPESEHSSHEDWLAPFFDEKGNWITPPDRRAIQPDALIEREEFWSVFDRCLDGLNVRTREAFVRRIVEDEDVKTICKALEITATNLYVILFRARTQMRHCLTVNWFNEQELRPPS